MRIQASTLVLGIFAATPALASPWAEVGNSQLRADMALLSSSGMLDNVTTQWALPWAGVLSDLEDGALAGQALSVRTAALRVRTQGQLESQGGFAGSALVGAASSPAIVYGFGGLGRGDGRAQVSLGWTSGGTSARLSLGAFTTDFTGRSVKFMPDETYIVQTVGDDVLVYAGWLSHWWGPGWISALALSNNARPMPQIGIQRIGSAESSWPVLNLLGPWRAEFFIGLLDDPRIDRNTVYNAFRIAFNPLQDLEIALARTEQLCGENQPCVPLRDTFYFMNDPGNVNFTNAQGQIDITWSPRLWGMPWQFYLSVMNEDSTPIVDSGTTHLFGITTFVPMTRGTPLRLTLEYTDSVATRHIFSFGNVQHGFAYNNGARPDGMRYRGRTLGFSLDSDSRLLSLQGGWSDDRGRYYELSLHRAEISNPNNTWGNIVTTAPVKVNMAELRITLPWQDARLDLAVRVQDDQPRPRSGFDTAFEMALRVPF